MSALLVIWLSAYVAPAAVAGAAALLWGGRIDIWYRRNIAIIHIALLASIAATQYALYVRGLSFPWYPGAFSVVIFIASGVLAFALLGKLGAGYAVSALIQELTMLSMAALLLPSFSVWFVILLIAPVFVVCHFLTLQHWLLKLVLVSLWSIVTIVLFVLTHNVYLIAALHTLLGSLLFYVSIFTIPSGMKALIHANAKG